MKKILCCIPILFFLEAASAQEPMTPIYYTVLEMPVSMRQQYYGRFDTKLLAEDLAGLLYRATGKQFSPVPNKPGATKGIFLLIDSSSTYSSNETGIVESDGKSFLRFKARYTTGISYAMYSWLEQLGFRFYLPGGEWTIIPALRSIFKKTLTKKIYKPHFPLRMFYASGGIYAVKGLDENKQSEKDWQQWYQRNRMGSDYLRIDGHIGELFNIVHQKEIEKDSTLVAPFNGKRQYSTGSKLDPTNKRGVALFSDWIVSEFKKEQKTFPGFLPLKKYATADPGDGLNYCHTPACETAFRSVSDQSFSIINETARKIKEVDARAGVSTLAYTERADTPSLRIEPNVHVMVVPTAFQSVSTSSELMLRWAKKTKNISQYDYLNIGVWAYDKPFFNLYQYHHKLRFLQRLKIQGMSFETSLSKFASGIQQYFILKFLCDPYSSIEKVLNGFCRDNFGNAAAPIKKLLKEWYFSDVHLYTNYDKPVFYEDELGRFIKYLLDAENTAGLTTAIKKRIEELKGYTIYLCKLYELFAELKSLAAMATDPSLKTDKAEEILTYTWQLYHTKIFHNTQLNDMLKQITSDAERGKWNYSEGTTFRGIAENASSIIHSGFEFVRKKYLPFAVPDYPVTDAFLGAAAKYSADSIRISTMDETGFGNFVYPLSFYCAAPGPLKIIYQTDSSKGKNSTGKTAIVSVESADYTFIKTNFIYKENSTGTINYFLPSKGHYKLYLSQYNATHVNYVIYPGRNLFYHNKKSIMMNGIVMQENPEKNNYPNKRIAFYVPAVDSIFFSNLYYGSSNTSRLYTVSGINIPVKENKQSFYNAAAIPPVSKNSFIFYENGVYRWPPVLKNTPPYYFFLKYDVK